MRSTARLLLSLVLAFVALILYSGKKIDPETFAVDPTMHLGRERWNGEAFTAASVRDIAAVVAREQQRPAKVADRGCERQLMLWLGNSQLHFINQFQQGDRLAPYWLRRGTGPNGRSMTARRWHTGVTAR